MADANFTKGHEPWVRTVGAGKEQMKKHEGEKVRGVGETQERSVARVENLRGCVWVCVCVCVCVCVWEREREILNVKSTDNEGIIPLKVHTFEGIFEEM